MLNIEKCSLQIATLRGRGHHDKAFGQCIGRTAGIISGKCFDCAPRCSEGCSVKWDWFSHSFASLWILYFGRSRCPSQTCIIIIPFKICWTFILKALTSIPSLESLIWKLHNKKRYLIYRIFPNFVSTLINTKKRKTFFTH